MASQVAKLLLVCVLKHKVTNSSLTIYKVGDRVPVWRGKLISNRIAERIGPYEIKSLDDEGRKLVHFDLGKSRVRPYNFTQIKAHLTPAQESQTFLMQMQSSILSFRSRAGTADDPFLTNQ